MTNQEDKIIDLYNDGNPKKKLKDITKVINAKSKFSLIVTITIFLINKN